MREGFAFTIEKKIPNALGRAGVIHTPHGDIPTPSFVVVGTKGTVKGLTSEQIRATGAHTVLANTYHLYLEPGEETVQKLGGVGAMVGFTGPTMTDSGGFQAFSLGAAFGKSVSKVARDGDESNNVTENTSKKARVTDDGVEFKSLKDGSVHFFTPEKSVEIQHALGADIFFAFDECTSPHDPYDYQKIALARTHAWAERCLRRHGELSKAAEPSRLPQALFGVVQGGRFEDLRRESARVLGAMDFDGYGIGGSFSKNDLATAVRWVNEELPETKPRHLLGIGEVEDIFEAVGQGCDTFDCVIPTRIGRHGQLFTRQGKINIKNAQFRDEYVPVDAHCDCFTCTHHTRAYLSHLFHADEMLGMILASIHNIRFLVRLVDDIRTSIVQGNFTEFKKEFLGVYQATI